MHIDAGEALRREWAQTNLQCEHPELVEEHDAEKRLTGKRFCKVCGQYQEPAPSSLPPEEEDREKPAA